LIGNPQITFFKAIYKRHTNFAQEHFINIFNGTPRFDGLFSSIIGRNCDLLGDILLYVELPALAFDVSWVNGIGHFMIDYVEVIIGGEVIDHISGQMIDIIQELSNDLGSKNVLYSMIGKYITFNKNTQTGSKKLLIQLPFWFCKNVALALPQICLAFHEIKIHVKFKPFSACWFKLSDGAEPPAGIEIVKSFLIHTGYYLDSDERRLFAQTSHEYLIEQVQEQAIVNIAPNTLYENIELFLAGKLGLEPSLFAKTNLAPQNNRCQSPRSA
jgi:hypothetical protein